MKIVAQEVITLLKRRKIRFSFDSNLKSPVQDVRATTLTFQLVLLKRSTKPSTLLLQAI